MSYQIHTHPGGLRFAIQHDDSPICYIGFVVRAGTRDETSMTYGLAHLVEHMLFKGTRLRSSDHIIRRAEEVGAELNAYTSKEETFIYAALPEAHFSRIFVLLTDIVRNSCFPAEELEKEKTVIVDEINSYRDSPSELIFDEFENILFRGSPLGHDILGTEKSVQRMTSDTGRSFLHRFYTPANMLCFVRGRVNVETVRNHLNHAFPCTDNPSASACCRKAVSLPICLPGMIKRRRDTHRHHVLIGGYAYSMHHPDRIGLSLLVNILGGMGMNSRLNMLLRERYGLVYNVEANYTAYTDTGLVTVYFGSASENATEALALVEDELQRMRREPLCEEELKSAKRQIKGQLLLADEQRESTFLSFGKSILHYGRYEPLETIFNRIDALTIADLSRIAAEIFVPERMCRLVYV